MYAWTRYTFSQLYTYLFKNKILLKCFEKVGAAVSSVLNAIFFSSIAVTSSYVRSSARNFLTYYVYLHSASVSRMWNVVTKSFTKCFEINYSRHYIYVHLCIIFNWLGISGEDIKGRKSKTFCSLHSMLFLNSFLYLLWEYSARLYTLVM